MLWVIYRLLAFSALIAGVIATTLAVATKDWLTVAGSATLAGVAYWWVVRDL